MPITNPVAISFSNQRLRIAADLMAQLYNLAGQIVSEWDAHGGTALIPNTSDVLQDSAAPNGVDPTGGDGRPVVTGAKLNNIINRLIELRSSNPSTGLAIGAPGVLDTILQVAVNTNPR